MISELKSDREQWRLDVGGGRYKSFSLSVSVEGSAAQARVAELPRSYGDDDLLAPSRHPSSSYDGNSNHYATLGSARRRPGLGPGAAKEELTICSIIKIGRKL